ncbi:12406_t:CDS:2, partial [Entrophospora sp. SA101]
MAHKYYLSQQQYVSQQLFRWAEAKITDPGITHIGRTRHIIT